MIQLIKRKVLKTEFDSKCIIVMNLCNIFTNCSFTSTFSSNYKTFFIIQYILYFIIKIKVLVAIFQFSL